MVMPISDSSLSEPRKLLIVAVPGLSARRDRWQAMESKLNECNLFGDRLVKWLYYDHGINHLSRTGLETFARRLEAKIGQESTSYDEIILVGHSLGALVARKACSELGKRLIFARLLHISYRLTTRQVLAQ